MRTAVTQHESEKPVKLEVPRIPRGFLTEKQLTVLSLRSRGFSQREIASQLGISRASVSMIEGRARRQVERARQTLKAYSFIQIQHTVSVDAGTRLQQVPMVVLQEADRFRIHLRSNMVEILRMVKKQKASLLEDGRTTKKIVFRFNERGKVSII